MNYIFFNATSQLKTMSINAQKLILVFLIIFGVVITTTALAQNTATESSLESVTEPLSDPYKLPLPVVAPLSRVTLYRTSQGYVAGVISVQLNGHYHTSLQLGSFDEVCLSTTDSVLVGMRLLRTGEDVKSYGNNAVLSIKPGRDIFVRVSDTGNGRALFTVVDAATAQIELQQTRRQWHAVSRFETAQPCISEVVAQPVPVVTQVEAITLGADALFEFGKADVADIGLQGRAELDRLVNLMQTQYAGFDKISIQVVGYADPLGNPIANQRLSAARASTIKSYMVAGGIPTNKISSEGRGDVSPIVTDCPRQATVQSIACNKPNRRVVVAVLRHSQ